MTRQQFALANNMVANGYGGYTIDNLLIKEFGYVLAYATNGKFSDVTDFDTIFKNQTTITQSIDAELILAQLTEEKMLNISHDTAIRNMTRLKIIVEKICGYMSLP